MFSMKIYKIYRIIFFKFVFSKYIHFTLSIMYMKCNIYMQLIPDILVTNQHKKVQHSYG